MNRRFVIILVVLYAVGVRAAINVDSLLNLPAMGLPIINYTPETNWEFGAAAQAYLHMPGATRTSIVQVDGTYSLSRQWYINASTALYTRHWLLMIRGGYREYPDAYYDLGNEPIIKPAQAYNSRRGYVQVQPQYLLPRHWSVGLNFHYLDETTSLSDPTRMLGVGIVAQYDSRDILFYPTHGLFFKALFTHYESLNGNYSRTEVARADLRHYVHLLATRQGNLTFAWQATTEWAIGKNTPFQLLPTLGGQDLVRGVRRAMYRDDAMMAVQAELRLPIWNFIHACVFAGVGDVYNTRHWVWTTPKVGYGLGIRLGINKAKVNIRLDLARNNIYKEWNTWQSYSFYLTATEAF